MPPIPGLEKDKKADQTSQHKEHPDAKIWNDSEVDLLKRWGEVSSSYRFLHDRAFRIFQFRNYCFTIPVIVLSTISGTASFSIDSFPENLRRFVPMIIGGVNIFVGIIQTIAQFLRISELAESHRAASTAYGKFSRNIATELSLPPSNRTYNGIDFVQMCRADMDRLLEQSPIIPMNLLSDFDKNPIFNNITKPDVLKITEIKEYKPSHDERIQNIVTGAAEQLKHFNANPGIQNDPHAASSASAQFVNHHIPNMNNIINNTKDQALKKIEEHRKTELNNLGENKIVSGLFGNNKLMNNISKSLTTPSKTTPESILKNVRKSVEARIEKQSEEIKSAIEEEINEANDYVINIKDDVTSNIDNSVNSAINSASKKINTSIDNANNIANNVNKKINNTIDDANNKINNTINDANDIASNIENKIDTTVDETKKSVNTKITKISSNVVQALDIEEGGASSNNEKI